MRTLYASLTELLRDHMRERLGGKEPDVNIEPHWRHGNLSAAEVLAEIRAENAEFLDGTWIE